MLVGNVLLALALLLGCERRRGTIHTACWKPWLMGTDRLVVRSAPSPGHGMNRGFPAAPQHPSLLHPSQSLGAAASAAVAACGELEPSQQPRPSPASAFLFVCLFMAPCLPRCPLSSLPRTGSGGEAPRGESSGGSPGLSVRGAWAAPAAAGPEVLPSHPRPSRGHLRESLDELGDGGPPSPQRNRGLGSTV